MIFPTMNDSTTTNQTQEQQLKEEADILNQLVMDGDATVAQIRRLAAIRAQLRELQSNRQTH